jgi:hypothetical protein
MRVADRNSAAAWDEYYREADRRRGLMGGDVFQRMARRRQLWERGWFAATGALLLFLTSAFIWLCYR